MDEACPSPVAIQEMVERWDDTKMMDLGSVTNMEMVEIEASSL